MGVSSGANEFRPCGVTIERRRMLMISLQGLRAQGRMGVGSGGAEENRLGQRCQSVAIISGDKLSSESASSCLARPRPSKLHSQVRVPKQADKHPRREVEKRHHTRSYTPELSVKLLHRYCMLQGQGNRKPRFSSLLLHRIHRPPRWFPDLFTFPF